MLAVFGGQSSRDKLHVRATTLAYWSAVGLVPLMVLGFALTDPIGIRKATESAVRGLLYDTVFASGETEVMVLLDQLLMRVDFTALGWLGALGVMFIGSQLFFATELAFNDVYNVKVDRSWVLRFVLFNGVIISIPTMIAGGFLLSRHFATAPVGGAQFLPLMITAVALVGAIKVLPDTRVSWGAALVGGVVSAVLFEGAKMGFGAYTEILGTKDNMARLYGSVAFLPVFLLWLNVLWLVVLLGVELSFVTQNRRPLLEAQREHAQDPHAHHRRPDGLFALGVLVALAREEAESGTGTGELYAVAHRCEVPSRHVRYTLDVLADADIVREVTRHEYALVHPPSEVTAAEVLRSWHEIATPLWRSGAVIGDLVDAVEQRLEEATDTNLAALAGDGDSKT
jgi:membrane protein